MYYLFLKSALFSIAYNLVFFIIWPLRCQLWRPYYQSLRKHITVIIVTYINMFWNPLIKPARSVKVLFVWIGQQCFLIMQHDVIDYVFWQAYWFSPKMIYYFND